MSQRIFGRLTRFAGRAAASLEVRTGLLNLFLKKIGADLRKRKPKCETSV